MRNLLIFFISLIFLSCSDNYQELRQDIFIQKFFDRNQSKDLARIVKYFDERVCITVGRQGIQGLVCYKEWFKITDSLSTDSIPLSLSYDDQWNFSKTLFQETINVLWEIHEPSKTGLYKELPHLILKMDGPYLKWLKTFAEEDTQVRSYYLQILQNGLNSETSRAIFQKDFAKWPVSDPRYRLIIAIDRLTVNSQRSH